MKQLVKPIKEPPPRFVDGTRDITEKDLAELQYRRLLEAHTLRQALKKRK